MQKIWLWIKGHWFYLAAGILVLGSIVFGGKRLLATLAEWARKRADRRIVGDALSSLTAAGSSVSDAQSTADDIAGSIDAGVGSVEAGANGIEDALGTASNLADGHHTITDIVRELARRYGVDAPADY